MSSPILEPAAQKLADASAKPPFLAPKLLFTWFACGTSKDPHAFIANQRAWGSVVDH